jgi:Xaa-Pro aminopeptidase
VFDQTEFAARRRKLFQDMSEQSIAILFAAPECIRSADGHYPYRQNSNFYYLTGFKEPEAVAVLISNSNGDGEFILFNRKRNPSAEQWTGKRLGQDGAKLELLADSAYPIEELPAMLPKLLSGKSGLYYTLGKQAADDAIVLQAMESVTRLVRSGVSAPSEIINLDKIISEYRLIKSTSEIAVMRHAGEVSAQAHVRAMKACKPGLYEYQLQAELGYGFLQGGCQEYAYTPIIGGGDNACVLHYIDNNQKLNDGELVLIDAGGEYHYYSSDITRTFPINGRFTPEQRAIYELVLKAQTKVIEMVRPGVYWNQMHEMAVKVLTEGLVELGLLKGDVETLIKEKTYAQFYMHNTGHWLGLDTHDVGAYKVDGEWRALEEGMVFTVEPGIYINPNTPDIDKKWWGIGVRIEDDILVTKTGCEIFTKSVPKTVEEIEALMAK